jgi:hypothetical protein
VSHFVALNAVLNISTMPPSPGRATTTSMNETVEPSSTPEPLDHVNALLECLREGRAGGKHYKYKSVLPFLYELRALVTIISAMQQIQSYGTIFEGCMLDSSWNQSSVAMTMTTSQLVVVVVVDFS